MTDVFNANMAAGQLADLRSWMRDRNSDRVPILRVRGISKCFGAVQALRNVDLDVYPGGQVNCSSPPYAVTLEPSGVPASP